MRIIFCFAQTFEEPVRIAGAETAVGQCEVRVEIDGVLEVLDRRVNVFSRERAGYEAAKVVAAAQVFFPGLGIVSHAPAEFFLLVIRQLETQAFENTLGDAVLQRENITALGVDAIAPEDLARQYIEQLRSNPQLIPASKETGRENGMHPKLASRLTRIDFLPLIFCDNGTGPNDQ